ncbi:MAG: CRISPR-associated endonuclease Cas6 [Chlorobi bacterium]|nr:CRISPR-associated endonuclease Cas6 [Chlorobiota bacterium]
MERAHPVPYQEFVFNQPLRMYEARLLRSAILKVIKPYHVLYHNHLDDGLRWGYPLIQYKVIKGHGAILYLGKGIEGIHALFNDLPRRTVRVGDREINLEIKKIVSKLYQVRTWDDYFKRYRIINWLPVQEENYERFRQITDEEERVRFLENILKNNIFSFAKGVDWHIKERVHLRIRELSPLKWVSYKTVKFITYDAVFDTNVFLPPHIGLGKGAAHNYGVVFHMKTPRQDQPLATIDSNTENHEQ